MQPRPSPLAVARAALWLIAVYAGFVVVGVIAGEVAGAPEPWEVELMRDTSRARTEAWARAMVAITHLGDALSVAIALGALAIGVTLRKARGWARFFSAALMGALGIHPVIKIIVERARPDLDPYIDVGGFAWPSGHAAAAAALATALAVFFRYRSTGSVPRWVMGAAVVYAGAVGMSRVVLGVHWPTDVVAGWIIGVAWVLILERALLRRRNP